jgi:hypothetical protein
LEAPDLAERVGDVLPTESEMVEDVAGLAGKGRESPDEERESGGGGADAPQRPPCQTNFRGG